MPSQTVFTPLLQTSRLLGLPRDWLMREAEAGRIPHIVIGRQLYFDSNLVAECIIARMKQNAPAIEEEHATSGDELRNEMPSRLQMPTKVPASHTKPPVQRPPDRGISNG